MRSSIFLVAVDRLVGYVCGRPGLRESTPFELGPGAPRPFLAGSLFAEGSVEDETSFLFGGDDRVVLPGLGRAPSQCSLRDRLMHCHLGMAVSYLGIC